MPIGPTCTVGVACTNSVSVESAGASGVASMNGSRSPGVQSSWADAGAAAAWRVAARGSARPMRFIVWINARLNSWLAAARSSGDAVRSTRLTT